MGYRLPKSQWKWNATLASCHKKSRCIKIWIQWRTSGSSVRSTGYPRKNARSVQKKYYTLLDFTNAVRNLLKTFPGVCSGALIWPLLWFIGPLSWWWMNRPLVWTRNHARTFLILSKSYAIRELPSSIQLITWRKLNGSVTISPLWTRDAS